MCRSTILTHLPALFVPPRGKHSGPYNYHNIYIVQFTIVQLQQVISLVTVETPRDVRKLKKFNKEDA